MLSKIVGCLLLLGAVIRTSAEEQTPESRWTRTKRPGTVVLVHGFLRGRGCMWALDHSFKKRGWRTVNWTYDSREKTINGHADDLVEVLRKLGRKYPYEPIHFLTHSLGGLLVRTALNTEFVPMEALIGNAVTIAPPHQGAILGERLGNHAFGRLIMGDKAGRELCETDDFSRFGEFPPGLPVLVIAGDVGFNPLIPGKDDGKVACTETRLNTKHEYVQLHAAHSWITWRPKTIKLARNFIRRGRADL